VKPGRVRFVGWCFHQAGNIEDLALVVNDMTFPARYGSPRADVGAAFRHLPQAIRCGFDVTVPLEPGVYRVSLRARVSGLGKVEYFTSSLLAVGEVRPGFMQSISYRVARRLGTGEGLPGLREVGPLIRAVLRERQRREPQRGSGPADSGSRHIDPYDAWLVVNRWGPTQAARLRNELDAASDLPRISLITPVFRPTLKHFMETAESVRQQIYANWEWCLADDASGDTALTKALEDLTAGDQRVRFVTREENGHISRCSNTAARFASGEFLAFLDHDDLLSPDALGEVALHLAANPDVDVLYSDEDKVDSDGRRFSHHFKPDWSPESLLSQMYLGHLFVVRRSLFERIGGFRVGFEGSQDHDLALRVTEQAREVGHVPRVLYHWRATEGSTAVSGDFKPYSFDAGIRAVEGALARRGVPACVERPDWAIACRASLFRHRFPNEGPSVAILIPTRNNPALLQRCLASLQHTDYRNYEVFVVDDGSDEPEARSFLEGLSMKVLRMPGRPDGFNFSRLCNDAARRVSADFLLFLNDDTEVRNPAWLSQMVGFARLSGVGAVGARLLFPDGTIQNAGILLNKGTLAIAFRRWPQYDGGYSSAALVSRNYGAVTAACMLTPRALFLEVGGFDEEAFPISFNDVDYCYRIADKGYRSVYAPEAELVHHEGSSREPGSQPAELGRFRVRYRHRIDPYLNPNLSAESERFEVQARRPALRTPRRLNAVMFSNSLDLTGAPLCQLELTVSLVERNLIAPSVISPTDGPLRARYEAHAIPVKIVPSLGFFRSDDHYEDALRTLTEDLRKTKPDVVYGNTLSTFYGIAAARRLGVPSVWNIRESESWQAFYADLPGDLADKAVRCFVDPYRVIYVSYGSAAVFSELNRAYNFSVVHDGFQVSEWDKRLNAWTRDGARADLGVGQDDLTVLLVGTVCERKGQHELVKALGRVRPDLANRVRCFIVGDRPGAYSTELNDLVNRLDPALQQRIRVVPETDDVAQYYRAADVFVCTSRIESYPRVTLEAMASGLPIISTPVFGLAEQLVDGVNALFYAPGNIPGLAAALERLLTDDGQRLALARQSSTVLSSLKTFDEMVDDYAEIFREASLT
jgi:O-antigen biosynthesis protein